MCFWFCEVMIRLRRRGIGVRHYGPLVLGQGPPHPAHHRLGEGLQCGAHEANLGPDYDSGITYELLTLFDYFKCTWSTAVTVFSLVVVIYGISIQAYILLTPPVGAFLIAICMLTVLFCLEGLIITIVGTQY